VRLALHALALAAGGALLGVAGNGLTPRPAPLGHEVRATAEAAAVSCELPGGRAPAVPRISVQEATPLCNACSAAFVDARGKLEFEAGHVSGAVHLAPGEPARAVLADVARFPTTVVYDSDPACSQAEEVARMLKKEGVADVRVLTGAWPAWMASGGPGASGPCALCSTSPGGQP